MKLRETFEQKGVWELVYVVGFYIPVWATINSAFDNSVEKILLRIIGLIICGVLGLGVYKLLNSKSHLTKSLVLIAILISVSLLGGQIETYLKDMKYDPCEICGFISVDKKTHECQICISKPWDESWLKEGYSSKEEYIKGEQLFWFSIQSGDQKVDFYLPAREKNNAHLSKDNNWKPLVTETEVREYSKKKWGE